MRIGFEPIGIGLLPIFWIGFWIVPTSAWKGSNFAIWQPCLENNLSYISDLVLARQELQREEYLNDIHARIEHLSAAHRYAEENPLDPIVRDEYGAPCRRKRVSFFQSRKVE